MSLRYAFAIVAYGYKTETNEVLNYIDARFKVHMEAVATDAGDLSSWVSQIGYPIVDPLDLRQNDSHVWYPVPGS